MQKILKEQADVIGEVANICIGNAATSLSMITNHATNITTPIVEVMTNEESLADDTRVLVKVPYTKGLVGTNLMVLDVKDAIIIGNEPDVRNHCYINVRIIEMSYRHRVPPCEQ